MLARICEEIMNIEEGLMYGTISFNYDALMSAMKPGHPMEILDSIIAEIFWDVQAGRTPSEEKIKSVIKNLTSFKNTFKVKELNKPIKELKAFLAMKYDA